MESLGDVRAAAGEGVTLSCQVFSSDEDVMVSWKRVPDRKLLSTNTYSYTSDIEHTVLHEEGRTVWHLKLAEVAGGHERFECRAIGSSGGDAADTVRLTPAGSETWRARTD
ncbi:uncharacterized protein LOC122244190 [Penaeus japonicus]|uniref:uncharacterized protein LOC122244190 n=1 Tax=Penaeus japonicus TaxID=27405 RepID=UPI001C70D787|nr:uncharacterized protein LOC122244190 [Penaeus japonicus]